MMDWNLECLNRQYTESWSSKCRGAQRKAYVIKDGTMFLLKDFCRWLGRKIYREEKMLLKQTIETDHVIIYVFKKTGENKSTVRLVAEVILAHGDNPEGVGSAEIHFADPSHPLSCSQRFRELCAAYRRQWPGVMIDKFQDAMIAVDLVKAGSHLVAAMQGCSPNRQSHVYKNNRYHFTADFLSWLRASLPEIEKVVYPVTSRKKIFDRENA